MGIQAQSGVPLIRLWDLTTYGDGAYELNPQVVWFRLKSSATVKVYFREEDFNADEDFLTLSANVPVEIPGKCPRVWLRGTGTVETVFVTPY